MTDASKPLWMILEDDQALRTLLVEMFRLWGRNALTFPDGFRAAAWLDAIEAGTSNDPLPQVALMDIRVPGPQGPEIAKRMREIKATSRIPIVIMTAYRLDPVEMQEITDLAHPDGFIHKGEMLFDDIQTTLERVVREAASHEAAAPAVEAEPAADGAKPEQPATASTDSAPAEAAAADARPADTAPTPPESSSSTDSNESTGSPESPDSPKPADSPNSSNSAAEPSTEPEKGVISVDD